MRINPPESCETIEVLLNEDKYPIAFRNKVEELMEQGAFEDEEKARRWLSSTPIVLEVYYEKHAGLFAVESDALETCPESLCSPYSRESFKE